MSRSSLRWLLAPVLASAALAIAACGGSDNKSSSSSSSSSASSSSGANNSFPLGKPVDGQKKGGHLTVIASDDVDNIDPGQAYYAFTYQVSFATVRPLYSVKPDDDGSNPQPDLAEGPPQISEDGKTVTIKIRKGIRYSPPYNKEVKAADVKYAIERAFTPAVPNGYINSYFGNIVGVDAFKSHKAKDISGITTPDDYTIQFKITGGDLVGALALPVSAPVPEAYAKKYDQAKGQSTYGQHQLATGPYMITKYNPGRVIELKRNPNWDASTDYKPAYLDSITVEEGNDDTTVGTRRIINGTSMVSGDFAAPPEELRRIVTSPAKDQLGIAPGAGMRYMGINTTIKPFDNVNVRKAVAAALNRKAMQTTRGGPLVGDVATHMIYPTTQGFDEAGGMTPDVDIFKNPQGDLALAQEYMKKAGYASGKYTGKEKVLMVGVQEGVAQRNAEVAQQGLQSLGFNVNLRLVTQDAMYTKYCQVPKAKVAICPNLGWIKDYADPRTIIDPLWNPKNIVPSGNVNFSEYRDPAFQKEMDDAINMPTGDARVQAFAALDKKISNDLVLGVAYLWDKYPVVHSKNVQIVNQLWNQGSPDLSWTSLK